ncbi:MAG: type VI secretion system ATPase TssH, partial [Deltaproteobacteria bacterium]|nr:type VI secretion system ATPase TssH [Deltaproteobacteria bacterium]
MDINRMTQKTQEALQDAQSRATRLGHAEVDAEHLLAALLGQQNGLAPLILEKAGASPKSLEEALNKELSRRPSVSGPGIEAGKVYITRRLSQLLERAA